MYVWFCCKSRCNEEVDSGSYLPACETRQAQEVATRQDAGVLIPLCANLTKLEGAADVAVDLVLLLMRQDKTLLIPYRRDSPVKAAELQRGGAGEWDDCKIRNRR